MPPPSARRSTRPSTAARRRSAQVGALTSELYGPNPRAGRRDRAVAAPAEHRHHDEAHAGGSAGRVDLGGRGAPRRPAHLGAVLGALDPPRRRRARERAHRPRRHRHDLRARERRARRRRPRRLPRRRAQRRRRGRQRHPHRSGGRERRSAPARRSASTSRRGRRRPTVPALEGLATGCRGRGPRARRGSSLGTITPRNDPALAAGHRDLGRSRRRVPRSRSGPSVNLVVASGRVTIIDVTGYTVDAATRELEGPESQLIVTTQEDPSCTGGGPADRDLAVPRAGRRRRSTRRSRSNFLLRAPLDSRHRSRLSDAGAARAPRAAASVNPDRLEPVAQQAVAALGEHALGVELHARRSVACGARRP